MAKEKKPALGKGLEALFGGSDISSVITHKTPATVDAEIAKIKLSDIEINPNQPRKDFNQETLDELSQSIKEHGVITPITVNKKGKKYVIIAGERRFRACQLAGLEEIPAYIRVVTEQETMQMALIENIQRDDLNAVEIALYLKALLDTTKMSQEELGRKIGKSRANIANYVRLLRLPAEVQLAIREDRITMGHARSIISVESEETQILLTRRIINEGLSVRQIENIVANMKKETSTAKSKPAAKKKTLPESHETFRTELSHRLSSEITITRSQRGKGMITIPFANDRDFERITKLLAKEQ